MLMKKPHQKRTAEEKEKLLVDINRLGIVVGLRKHNLSKTLYYHWLERYNAHGLEGLEDQRRKGNEALLRKLEKENKMLKLLLSEKELESKMKDELLKKKIAQWDKGKK